MKSKKSLAIAVCAVLLVAATVVGTLAYLTDRDTVTNTFTVGDVQITLDETELENGEPTGKRTEEGNAYHLIPGKTYVKDPMVTVEAGSEPSYVRMIVKINKMEALDKIFAAHELKLTDIFQDFDADWGTPIVTRANDTITYEFRYADIVDKSAEDQELPKLFTAIAVPGEITREEMQTIADLTITVEGHAIQAETFDNADEAWTAFKNQVQ